MDDIVDVRVCGKDLIELGFVGDIAGEVFGSPAADELDAVEDFVGGVVEVVDNDDFVAGFEEREGGEGTDVAGAAVTIVRTGDSGVVWGRTLSWESLSSSKHVPGDED